MPTKSRRRPVATDRRFRRQPVFADIGPQERWQHSLRVLRATEQPGVLAARNGAEHIVDILVTAGLLSAEQGAAAMKFREDFHAAHIAAHVTAGYNPERNMKDTFYGKGDRSPAQEAAYKRWRKAMQGLGLKLGDRIAGIICYDQALRQADLPQLREGLELLIILYGLPRTADTPKS